MIRNYIIIVFKRFGRVFVMKIIMYHFSIFFLFISIFALSSNQIEAENLIQNNLFENAVYVSPSGNDSNPGTIQRPVTTLKQAFSLVEPGETIVLREGIYYESISIPKSGNRKDGNITITNYQGEQAIIDGSKFDSEDNSGELMRIDHKSYLCISGIEFRNLNLEYARGIFIDGGSRHITIRKCKFHDINTVKLADNDFGGANAISIKSYDMDQQNYDILIDSNQIYDCILGFSEALVLSGNTKEFVISNNSIQNVTNIGIDIAGHYGDYQGDPATNQARYGIIVGNTVKQCKSDYGSGAASGIYIDGGRSIIIKNNTVSYCDYGITVGCEAPEKTSSQIDVIDNIIYQNDKSALSIGGYSTEVGSVRYVSVEGNKTYQNNLSGIRYQSEITLKVCSHISVSDNIFYSVQSKVQDFSIDSKFYPMMYNVLPAQDVTFSNNIYYSTAGSDCTYFRWKDQEYIGFDTYTQQTGMDLSSHFYDPLYPNPQNGEL